MYAVIHPYGLTADESRIDLISIKVSSMRDTYTNRHKLLKSRYIGGATDFLREKNEKKKVPLKKERGKKRNSSLNFVPRAQNFLSKKCFSQRSRKKNFDLEKERENFCS